MSLLLTNKLAVLQWVIPEIGPSNSMPSAPAERGLAYVYARMSTEAQMKGDSLRRQLERAQNYAERHGLKLAEGSLNDIGISAWHGRNAAKGALGAFLRSLRAGQIKTGSFLLVESVDRLTRQNALPALSLLMELLDKGLILVTLQNEQRYHKASNYDEISKLLVELSRASNESETKNDRGKQAWIKKRREVSEKKLTSLRPAWLDWDAKRKTFTLNKHRAAVVRQIFEDSANGIGSYVIERRLNQRRTPTFGKAKLWQRSYIAKILSNRAAIGEFQPHTLEMKAVLDPEVGCDVVRKWRNPIGPPILDYYPAVIDASLFFRAQRATTERRSTTGGRKGLLVSNLFSKVAVCAYCSARMLFENKGQRPKGGTYLVCSRAKKGGGCDVTRWSYAQFEASFLTFVKEVELDQIFAERTSTSQTEQLDATVKGLIYQKSEIEKRRDRLIELYQAADIAMEAAATKLKDYERHIIDLRNAIQEGERHQMARQAVAYRTTESKEKIKSLIARLQSGSGGDDMYRIRSEVAAKLRSLLASVAVAPAGDTPTLRHHSEATMSKIESLNKAFSWPPSAARYFEVKFNNGSTTMIYPDSKDPLRLCHRRIESPGGKLISREDERGEVRTIKTITEKIGEMEITKMSWETEAGGERDG